MQHDSLRRRGGAPARPRLAASGDEHQPIRDIMVLRQGRLLAKARRDDAAYRDLRDRYRDLARSLGFEGHMKWAEAMP